MAAHIKASRAVALSAPLSSIRSKATFSDASNGAQVSTEKPMQTPVWANHPVPPFASHQQASAKPSG